MTHRVNIILDCLELGGAERQALLLASALHKDPDYEVQVIGLGQSGKAAELLKEQGIDHLHLDLAYSYGKLKMLSNVLKVRKALKRFKPTAVIPYTYWPNVLVGLAWKRTSAKVGLWNQRDEGRNVFKTFFEKKALSNASFIVSNSYEGKEFLVDEMGIPKEAVTVINNGVRLAEAKKEKASWTKELGLTEEHSSAVMVANLHHYKDHKTLVEAWKTVVDELGTKAVLLLAGRFVGTEKAIAEQAKALGIEAQVRLLGGVDDVPGLLHTVDLLVHSSNKEGCPNGVLEGMLAGRPVVATNISGCRQALGHDYAYLSQPDTAEDLAQKLIELLRDSQLGASVGAQNQQRVQTEFSPERMVEQYQKLIAHR